MAGDSDITSQNIVGYAGSQLDDNYGAKATIAMFANVGEANKEFKLSDIKPIAVDKVEASDLINTVYFQKVSNGGETIEGSNRVWDGSKWTDESGNDKSTETYAPGEGLWMYNQSYNPSTWEGGIVNLQSSGEVIQENVIADLDDMYGAVLVGNPFPTAITLADIIPYVDSGAIVENTIYFQKLTNGGETVEGSNRIWNVATSKWTDESGNDMSAETLEPGEGVWMYNQGYDPSTWLGIPAKVRFVAPTF